MTRPLQRFSRVLPAQFVQPRRFEHGLGEQPQSHPAEQHAEHDFYPGYEKVPAFYTVTTSLGGADNAVAGNSVPLRPEPFVCRRITWASSGDLYRYIGAAALGAGSAQGRSVEVSFEDEFTKFLGGRPSLLSALFGDSQGYLDLPHKGYLFQGKQALIVNLRRLTWPIVDNDFPPVEVRFDVTFHGFGLLPMGTHESGSAG